MMAVKVHSGQV